MIAHITVDEWASPKNTLVKIDDIFVQKYEIECLLQQDGWQDDNKDQGKQQSGSSTLKIYFEEPIISTLFKRIGKLGLRKLEDDTLREYFHKKNVRFKYLTLCAGCTTVMMSKIQEVWVQNSKPYLISLSVKNLQLIVKQDQPIDRETFNLVVRNFDIIYT
uniref:Uncharacterized protein n=1 Tax=Leersia perrieri TaxID=77586 RepID=A0A0D9XIA8_9ORYZ